MAVHLAVQIIFMSSVSVNLRKGKGKVHQIYLHFNYGRKKQYRFATGLSIQDKSIGVKPTIR